MEEKKSNRGFIVVIVCLILLCFGLLGYIGYDFVTYHNEDKSDKVEKKIDPKESNTNIEDSKESTDCVTTTAKCSGTYYGEDFSEMPNGLKNDLRYTYVLKEDGTYTADFSGVQKASGSFIITGNTITFVRPYELTGPDEEYPKYYSNNYFIADDCSYIKVIDSSSNYSLKLFKK